MCYKTLLILSEIFSCPNPYKVSKIQMLKQPITVLFQISDDFSIRNVNVEVIYIAARWCQYESFKRCIGWAVWRERAKSTHYFIHWI